MRQECRIGVVIPALNEEKAIGKVIEDIPSWIDRIVVVDNGSHDRTQTVARQLGADVVHEPRMGYGAACQAGIRNLTDMDIIVFVDGDYSDYPEEMDRLVDPILSGAYVFVVGSRVRGQREPGALSYQQRIGNWLACKLMRLFWGVKYTDLGPFRAIRANALRSLAMSDQTYGWTIEMQIKAALAKLPMREVAVSYRPRIGVSKISGTVKGTVLAGLKILGTIGRFAFKDGIAPLAERK